MNQPHIPDDARIVPPTNSPSASPRIPDAAYIIPRGVPSIPEDARIVPSGSSRVAGRATVAEAVFFGETEAVVVKAEVKSLQVSSFTTSKGSVYTRGDDGKYARYKTATGEHMPPTDLTVFVKPNNAYADQGLVSAAYMPGPKNGRVIVIEKGKAGSREITDISHVTDPRSLYIRIVGKDQSGRMVPGAEPEFTASLTATEGAVVYEIEQDRRTGQSFVHVGNNVATIIS